MSSYFFRRLIKSLLPNELTSRKKQMLSTSHKLTVDTLGSDMFQFLFISDIAIFWHFPVFEESDTIHWVLIDIFSVGQVQILTFSGLDRKKALTFSDPDKSPSHKKCTLWWWGALRILAGWLSKQVQQRFFKQRDLRVTKLRHDTRDAIDRITTRLGELYLYLLLLYPYPKSGYEKIK